MSSALLIHCLYVRPSDVSCDFLQLTTSHLYFYEDHIFYAKCDFYNFVLNAFAKYIQ